MSCLRGVFRCLYPRSLWHRVSGGVKVQLRLDTVSYLRLCLHAWTLKVFSTPSPSMNVAGKPSRQTVCNNMSCCTVRSVQQSVMVQCDHAVVPLAC